MIQEKPKDRQMISSASLFDLELNEEGNPFFLHDNECQGSCEFDCNSRGFIQADIIKNENIVLKDD